MEPQNHMSKMEQAEGDRGTVERELKRQDQKLAEQNQKAEDTPSSKEKEPSTENKNAPPDK